MSILVGLCPCLDGKQTDEFRDRASKRPPEPSALQELPKSHAYRGTRLRIANLKLSLRSGLAGGSSLPSRAELHRGLVARSERSGKSADVSFTLDISGKRQRAGGLADLKQGLQTGLRTASRSQLGSLQGDL